MAVIRDQTKVTLDRAVLEQEVGRVIAAADRAGLTVRAVGSLAVSIHCPASASLLPAFARTYADIDLVGYRREARRLATLLAELGYVEDREIFITSEGYRAIFQETTRRIHVDVFFDRLAFCHTIPIDGRLALDRPTIPLAELLLTKLQIIRINEKDVVDVALLLLEHEPAVGDAETIDVARIARLCAEEWGLWRTVSQNLEKVEALVAWYGQLSPVQRELIQARSQAIKATIDAEPKPLAWRVRARIGDRRQWWADVDEVL